MLCKKTKIGENQRNWNMKSGKTIAVEPNSPPSHTGSKVAVNVVKSYGYRINYGIAVALGSRYQAQLIDPVNKVTDFLVLFFLIVVAGLFEGWVSSLKNKHYHLLQQWLQSLIEIVGVVLSWFFAFIVLDFYGDSLNPILGLDSVFRTITLIIIVTTFTTLLAYAVDKISETEQRLWSTESKLVVSKQKKKQ